MKVFAVSAFLYASAIGQVAAADSPALWRQPTPTRSPLKSLPPLETSYPLASNVVDIRAGAKAIAPKQSVFMKELIHRLKIGFYFALWYALNIVYNSKFK